MDKRGNKCHCALAISNCVYPCMRVVPAPVLMFLHARYRSKKTSESVNGFFQVPCIVHRALVTRAEIMHSSLSHSDPSLISRRNRCSPSCLLRSAADATTLSSQPAQKNPLTLPRPIPVAHAFHELDVKGFENGALLIDKPIGWTSMDVCAKLRTSLRFVNPKLKVGLWLSMHIFSCKCHFSYSPLFLRPFPYSPLGCRSDTLGL